MAGGQSYSELRMSAIALQALLMVLFTLMTLREQTPLRQTWRAAAVGINGHVGVVLSVALLFAFGETSGDMLYIGLVLIAVSGAIIGSGLGWQIFDPRTTPSVAAEAVSSPANRLGHKLIRLTTPARKD